MLKSRGVLVAEKSSLLINVCWLNGSGGLHLRMMHCGNKLFAISMEHQVGDGCHFYQILSLYLLFGGTS